MAGASGQSESRSDLLSDMEKIALAYYFWPPRYVGEQPWWEETGPQSTPNPSVLGEVVATMDLSQGVRVRVFRDGMVAFMLGDLATSPYDTEDASGGMEWTPTGARLANAHLACLLTAIGNQMLAPSEVTTLWSMLQVEFETGKFRGSSDYTGSGARLALHMARRGIGDLGDWRFYRGRPLVTTDQIDRSFALLDMLLRRPSRDMALLRAEMLFRAEGALVHTDRAGSLTIAWAAAEGMLSALLARYLDENQDRPAGEDKSGNRRKFINDDRKKFLQGSEMTARHTMELLSLLDILPFELYQTLRRCAKARNDWLHAQTEPSSETAFLAVRSLRSLFELVEGIPLSYIDD
jgi:hypothetical protein